MKISTRGLWSGAAIMFISLTVAVVGANTVPNANAQDGVTETNTSGKTSETEHSTTVTENTVRTETTENKGRSTVEDRTAAEITRKAKIEAATAAAKERREAAGEKLTAKKLKACENRQANINERTTRISDRGTKHLALFTSIAERAKAFYVKKGNVLANYDTLVADVEAKKVAAQTTVDTIATSKATFTCEGNDPKLAVDDFKAKLTLRNNALKEYRTAVKNLIVGIKSVNSTTTPAADNKQTSEVTR
jgi:hypothetical protein